MIVPLGDDQPIARQILAYYIPGEVLSAHPTADPKPLALA
jgi:hypothetical protein